MEGFEGPQVPPCGGEAVQEALHAGLAWGLEQLYVTSQLGHEGPGHHVWHLEQLVVEQAVMAVCHLLELLELDLDHISSLPSSAWTFSWSPFTIIRATGSAGRQSCSNLAHGHQQRH